MDRTGQEERGRSRRCVMHHRGLGRNWPGGAPLLQGAEAIGTVEGGRESASLLLTVVPASSAGQRPRRRPAAERDSAVDCSSFCYSRLVGPSEL